MFEVIQNFVLNFLSIVWEALPFIIVGAIIAGILEELLPQQALAKLLPKHPVPAILIGGALGLIFPMCECGIVVVMRRLLKKGLPLSCCVAYMLAGPILNPIVLGSTYAAFYKHVTIADNSLPEHSLGLPVVLLRAGLGYLVACLTALVVHIVAKKAGEKALLTATALPPSPAPPKGGLSLGLVDAAPAAEPKRSVWQRVSAISQTALNDFIDITVFLIIGSLLSAVVKTNAGFIAGIEGLSQQVPALAVPLMMFLAFVLCLCSEADAFLAASFKGMSLSAKLGFLVFGPMLDIKLLLMYTRVFRPKLILTIVSCTAVLTMILTTAVHPLYNPRLPGAGGKAKGEPTSTVPPPPATTPAPGTPATPASPNK